MLFQTLLLITCLQLTLNARVSLNIDYLKLNNDLNDDLFSSLDHMQLLIHSHEEITLFIKEIIQYQHTQLYLAKQ